MSVKFDFNKMETEGDPEAWVVFNCSMCATPECQYEDDSGSVLSSIVNILKYSFQGEFQRSFQEPIRVWGKIDLANRRRGRQN